MIILIIVIILITIIQLGFSRITILADYQLRSIESGFEALKNNAFLRTSFYLLAVLFVLFDLELVLILPLVLNLNCLPEKFYFFVLIVARFIYVTLLWE